MTFAGRPRPAFATFRPVGAPTPRGQAPTQLIPLSREGYERVQTGVRIERRLLKSLKAVAEYYDYSLGELLEAIVLHSFRGTSPFDAAATARFEELMRIYDVDPDPVDTMSFTSRVR